MKKLMSLVLSGIAIIALSGCGGSSDGGSGGGSNPTTPDEVKTSIVGTWKTACYEDDPSKYVIEKLTFNADMSGQYIQNTYSKSGCDAQDTTPTEDEDITFDYSVGVTVKASDGNDAVELNLDDVASSDDFYTMVRFDANKLLLADSDDGGPHDGNSSDKRANDFSDLDPFVRQ